MIEEITLRSKLIEIETSIKIIAGEDIDNMTNWAKDEEKRDNVEKLLQERCKILNQMFLASPIEIDRFKQVNNMLSDLTLKLFNRVKELSLSYDEIYDPTFDEDYEIEGTLCVIVESSDDILSLCEDDFYGSEFLLMNHILYSFYNERLGYIEQFSGKVITKEEKLWSDDGISWNEYPFRNRVEFDDILICHAVHDICNHKMYSIPDLLRLNNYWAETTLTLQKFITQQ